MPQPAPRRSPSDMNRDGSRDSTCPVCCSRHAIDAPNANTNAPRIAPAQCQPRSRIQAISAMAPANCANSTVTSTAHRLGSPLTSASSRNGGEKIMDWGSATCGWPANTCGVHHGHSPRAMLCARNWICGWKCALASQGMVTRPMIQGQTISSQPPTSVSSAGPNGHAGSIGSRASALRSTPELRPTAVGRIIPSSVHIRAIHPAIPTGWAECRPV
jgi:hypothetical protein